MNRNWHYWLGIAVIAIGLCLVIFSVVPAADEYKSMPTPKGDVVMVKGFCMNLSETKVLVGLLSKRYSEYTVTQYFAAETNTCYHERTHNFEPFLATVVERVKFTFDFPTDMGMYPSRAIAIYRVVSKEMPLYVWYYVDERSISL